MKKPKSIKEPSIGSVVTHTGRTPTGKTMKGYPCDVYIVRGCFLDPIYQRLSNWWTWRKVLSDNTLGKEESGYGSFTKTESKY